MSQGETLVLGLIAGTTILLGLPVGRSRRPAPALRQLLIALATGILIFLVWDVLVQAWSPVDAALARLHDGRGGPAPVAGYAGLFLLGIATGLLALVYYESWLERRTRADVYPSGMVEEGRPAGRRGVVGWPRARRLSLLIASGIGLHNFGEGLAIGGSAALGAIGLATVLVIGFALHNATEGFGIVAPLAAEGDRPGWGFLLLMGTIGGGPTLVGTVIGRQFTSTAVSVIFLSLAAGSILYVVVQLLGVAHRAGRKKLLYWGLLAGLAAGFLTDMVVTAGGA